ncbi:tRNA(Ile)-lysidine synthase [Lentibacillus populi]|uniref:tRNA(Ile)-lysidine synthase n=1 Tax=Lentibacillus populi TaxID=1827502 RepID=A0A9W5X6Y3_9BACI|nr:tRNA lysidine(34) synthetase TilS [Lentibacillus populi]GGB51248.1 tRNA(Ile)-lysidine synthase [Lentibacillus populi]
MREAVMAFIKKHRLLENNRTILAGVSGGPDSMALLHFLWSIQTDYNLRIIAVSVDHQLRGAESEADLTYVKEMCEKWNIEFYGTFVDVPSYKLTRKVGTEVAARELRYQVFSEQMKKHQASYLALGHHGDDQVETMLMGLTRTANPTALAGIPVKRRFATGLIVRPLLGVSKREIETYCEQQNIIPRRDPTNEGTEFTRNYFRNKVVPLLKIQNGNIHTTVQHLSESLQADEQYLHNEASRLFDNVITMDQMKSKATLQIDHFQSHPLALQRRFYHLILNYLYDELPKDLSYIHEEQFFALLASEKANVRIDFPRELKVEKSYQMLNFYFYFDESQSFQVNETLPVPGQLTLPDGSVISTVFSNHSSEDENTYVCCKDQIVLPLHIRTRKAGDRMCWKGLNGSKKIKDIFIDEKIPVKERDNWPLVTDNKGEILWLIGLRKGQPRKQANNTSFIKICYEKGNM